MNYVFISPAYPVTCTSFCEKLSMLGVTVLGIGDVPYDALSGRLKAALTEYYYVDTLEDYDQMYRAAAFFIHKYGRIDWLESMNEYWLETDARLRTDFNIGVGTREEKISEMVKKSEMKRIFNEAGIPTARQHIVSDIGSGKAFTAAVGYPVIVKPDTGVGANGAMKIRNEKELAAFYNDLPEVPYVMEEFMSGDICTYDAVIDSRCDPLFESMCTYPPVIDSVNNDEDIHYYTSPDMPERLRELGRKTVKAFGADRRFVHFEFIKLAEDLDGVGKAGDFAGVGKAGDFAGVGEAGDFAGVGKAGDFAIMEVNMRPAGGHDPDMMNYAQSADVFRIYAEMVTCDKRIMKESGEKYYCAYAARKDGHEFSHSHEEIMEKYGSAVVLQEEMPPIDWPSMGRYVYMAKFRKREDMDSYFSFVLG